MAEPKIVLVQEFDAPQLQAARTLFGEYAKSLNVDLCFQNFASELASLPGDYATPGGALLVAWVDGQPAGCGAMRPLLGADYANACEMKRLFVRPAYRRLGLGRMLAAHLLNLATQAGYSTLLLDTLDDMEAAREMYASLGFEEIPPYYFNPIPGAHYLMVDLDAASTRW
jgi:putative acetyltransferase